MIDPEQARRISAVLQALSRSQFRSRFHLSARDKQYIRDKGWPTIARHGRDFIAQRLAPAQPANDGKQTPMRGHPVFIAQHATATCCRSCLYKWHKIAPGKPLTAEEQAYVLRVIGAWLRAEMREN